MATLERSDPHGGGRRRAPWWVRWVAFIVGAGVFSWSLAAVINGGRPGKAGDPAGQGESYDSTPQTPPGAAWERRNAAWEREDDMGGGEGLFEFRHGDEEDGWEWEDDAGGWQGPGAAPAPVRRTPDARTRPS